MTVSSKEEHCNRSSLKLSNPSTHCKTHWSLLKTMVNGRRVPVIPPIQIGDKFITSFTEKAEVLNGYFAKQCRVIDNNSQIPNRNNFYTNERLSKIKFVNTEIY